MKIKHLYLLKRPSIIDFLIASVVSVFKKNHSEISNAIPQKIGRFQLIEKIKKESQFENYAIGKYRYKGKNFIIKTWRGERKDICYYALVSEYISNTVLQSKFTYLNKSKKTNIYIPKVVEFIKGNNSYSLVSEYISGKSLSKYPLNTQAKILEKISHILPLLTVTLNSRDKKYLRTRGFLFYLLSLPFIVLLALASNPGNYKIIFKHLIRSIWNIKFIKNQKLVLNHRDLMPPNVKIRGSKIYLLDLSEVALTLPNYDISYFSIEPNLHSGYENLSEKTKSFVNSFLKNYIAIQKAGLYKNKTQLNLLKLK